RAGYFDVHGQAACGRVLRIETQLRVEFLEDSRHRIALERRGELELAAGRIGLPISGEHGCGKQERDCRQCNGSLQVTLRSDLCLRCPGNMRTSTASRLTT